MNEKNGDEADEEAREKQAAELQAQIDEIISGKRNDEVEKPRTLRDLTRPRIDSTPESEVEND